MKFVSAAHLTGGGTITGDLTISGDLTVSGSNTYTYDEQVDGQVWIKDSTASSATQGGHLRLFSDDGAALGDTHRLGVLEFGAAEDTSSTITIGARIEAIADAAWSASENGADMVFYTTDGNASQSEVMRLTADNLVGIGNSAPAAFLHVGSPSTASDVAIIIDVDNASTYTPALKLAWDGTPVAEVDMQFDTRATTGFKIGTLNSYPMSFVINDVTKMYIDGATGNVGIGTANPATVFTINGDAGPQMTINSATTPTGSSSTGPHMYFRSGNAVPSSATVRGWIGYHDNADEGGGTRLNIRGYADTLIAGASSGIGLYVDTSNNVGIGTDAPAQKLHLQDGHLQIRTNSADAEDNNVWFQKSRNATDGLHTVVQEDDDLGSIVWDGSDGNSFETAAKILAQVDGEPFTSSDESDMPGRLVFMTTPNGTASPAERMRIDSAGDVTLTGDLKMADGKGIDFSATSDGTTMSSELLDDYEEGTWTPTDVSGAGLTAAATAYGKYTKVGNVVHAKLTFTYPATADTATPRIGGLPYAAANDNINDSGTYHAPNNSELGTDDGFGIRTNAGATYIELIKLEDGGDAQNDDVSGLTLNMLITYWA